MVDLIGSLVGLLLFVVLVVAVVRGYRVLRARSGSYEDGYKAGYGQAYVELDMKRLEDSNA